jgi:hypothetical protein
MGDWAYIIAGAVQLGVAVPLYRHNLAGSTRAAAWLAVAALLTFLTAWVVAGRVAPQIMVPAIVLFAIGSFIYWRFILPVNIRRRRGVLAPPEA